MNELWKSIPGYEGYYSASNLGRIKSETRIIQRKDGGRGKVVSYKERLMSTPPNGKGYCSFPAMRDGKRTSMEVHRIVYLTWHGEIPDGLRVDHIDDNKLNNHLDNLQLLTPRENTLKAWKATYNAGFEAGYKQCLTDQGTNFNC